MNISLLLATVLSLARRVKESVAVSPVEELYRQYGYILRRRCRRILRNDALVEDAMQEIFLTLCRCHEQYRGDPQMILAWLYRITTTHCLRLLNKDRCWLGRLIEDMEESSNASSSLKSAMPVEDQLTINEFLEELPQQECEAVLYRYVSGMTQEEIAEVMEVTRDQVRRWLKHFQQRGRVVLRERAL